MDAQLKRLERVAEVLQKGVRDASATLTRDFQVALEGLRARALASAPGKPTGVARPESVREPRRVAAVAGVHRTIGISEHDNFGRGELKVLRAIAQHGEDGTTRNQLTVLTGYKRSTRDTYLQRLQAAGLALETGAGFMATAEGIAALGPDFEPLPTGDELRDHWMDRLPEGERKVLQVLIENHPEAVDRDLISERTGYARSSRDTYLQRLSSRRLVDLVGRGFVRASGSLFG